MRQRMRRADAAERIFRNGGHATPRGRPCAPYIRVKDERGEGFWIYRTGENEDAATGFLMGCAALWR